MSDSFYKNEMEKEMILNMEIQKQLQKSLPAKYKAQKKFVNPITQQMIDDYKQQFKENYTRDGTVYKYIMPEIQPTLEKFDETKAPIFLDPAGIVRINNEIKRLLAQYTRDSKNLKNLEQLLKDTKENLNIVDSINGYIQVDKNLENELDNLENELDNLKKDINTIDWEKKNINDYILIKKEKELKEKEFKEKENERKKKQDELEDYVIKTEKEKNIEEKDIMDLVNTPIDQFKQDIADIENNLYNITPTRINNNLAEITRLQNDLIANDQNKADYDNLKSMVDKRNQQKLKDYSENIRILNQGQINIQKMPEESEEDYLNRLIDLENVEEDERQVEIFNNNEFKKNLKTLISSEWKIENITKAFEINSKFLFNKTFAGFKKYFTEVYGSGKKDLDVDEYISLINRYLDSEAPSIIKKTGAKGETKGKTKGETARETTREIEEETKAEVPEVPDEFYDELFDDGYTPAPAPAQAPAPAPAPAPATAVATIVADLPEVEARTLPPPPPEPMTPFEGIPTAPLNNVFYDLIQNNKTMIIQEKSPVMKAIYLRHDEADVYYSYNNADYKSFASIMIGKNLPLETKIEQAFFEKGVLSFNNYTAFFTMLRPYAKTRPKKGEERKRNLKPSIEMFVALLKRMGVKDRGELTGAGLTGKALQGFKKPEKSKKSKTTGKPTGKALQGLKKPEKPQKPKKQLVVQKGASIKEVPYRCEFGKSVILLNKLYYNNILSVKDSKGINIQGIPNSKVDDKFVNIIMKICNNEDINNKDILELTDKDAILFSVLMNKSGLKKKYNIDNTKSIKALKDRLALVEGQMLAGNTNDEIKTELYDIVFKLAQLGATSLSVARKYFKDTEKLMF